MLWLGSVIAGCSTLGARIDGGVRGEYDVGPGFVYSGVSANMKAWQCANEWVLQGIFSEYWLSSLGYSLLIVPLLIIDLPLSAVADTVHLPADVFSRANEGEPPYHSCRIVGF
ncbi:YceK/YidQ family lipoprotein [Alkalilimnicola ehrlichii]|nr:YceK/YidQ family lipoprotein [Alkalilimnicola ehrlichii]